MAIKWVVSGIVLRTHTSLQLNKIDYSSDVHSQDLPRELVLQLTFKNQEFGVFADLVREFLSQISKCIGYVPTITIAGFGIPGPVDSYRTTFKNRSHWIIDGSLLEKELNIKHVTLLNNCVCTGYGLLFIGDDDVITLQDAPALPESPIACLGAGSGLGECFLTFQDGEYDCWPSEGGHCEFAPRNELEIELLMYTKSKYNEKFRVSVERICSDRGLVNVLEFLMQKYPERIDKDFQSNFELARDKSTFITEMTKTDELCQLARDITVSTYGSEAGCCALKWLPYGGLYITGSMIDRNSQVISTSPIFMDAYLDKGRVSEIIKEVPVKMVVKDGIEVCLEGVLYACCKNLRRLEQDRLMAGVVALPRRNFLWSGVLAFGVAVVGFFLALGKAKYKTL